MSKQSEEAAEIKKLPIELLDYLPAKRWRRSVEALIAVAILLLVFSSIVLGIKVKYARMDADLNRHETMWESKGISSYAFRLEGWSDEGHARILIVVEDGVVTSKEHMPTSGQPNNPDLVYDDIDTVPELFAKARETIRQAGTLSTTLWEARVAYDPVLGYPTYIGYGLASFLGSAGQYSYNVPWFRVILPGEQAK